MMQKKMMEEWEEIQFHMKVCCCQAKNSIKMGFDLSIACQFTDME